MVNSPKKQRSTCSRRKDCPFTKDQEAWIILEYGRTRSCTQVRRGFRKEYKMEPKHIPTVKAFHRVVTRFLDSKGHTRTRKPPGPITSTSPDDIERVKNYFEASPRSSIRTAAAILHMSYSKVWSILRLKLKWNPYKPHNVQTLSDEHRRQRRTACNFFSTKPREWFRRVLWSDEKWFVRIPHPNRQNERIWAPHDPEIETNTRNQGESKVMCWAAMVDSTMIIHWFEGSKSVTGDTYLEMLKEVVWPKVRAVATKKNYYFQQDGATVQTTKAVRKFLAEKFGPRVISRLTDTIWPAKSPDLSPLDFWFWGVAMEEVRRVQPDTMEELKQIVEEFAEAMEKESIHNAAEGVLTRSKVCLKMGGGAFEYAYKKMNEYVNGPL